MSGYRLEENSVSSDDDFVITNKQIFFIVLNFIDHILIIGTTGYICYKLSTTGDGLKDVVNLHGFLLTIGYVLLMAEAIVALAGENTWTFCLTRRGNSNLHWILQVTGAICTVTGVVIIYRAKRSTHFATIHSFLGITSVIAMAVVFLSGLPALFAGRLRKKIKPVLSKFTHNTLGILCFLTGISAQVAAYQIKFLRKIYGDGLFTIFTVTTCLVAVLSLIAATRQLVDQFKGTLKVIKK